MLLLSLLVLLLSSGCKKYLDKKPNQKLATFTSLNELQAVLDAYFKINESDPAAGDASGDDYYLTSSAWGALSRDAAKRMYIWETDNIFVNVGGHDWTYLYDNIYKSNIILHQIDKISNSNGDMRNNITGSALYIRANCFLQAVSIWSLAYDSATANTDLGIPLRLDPDFNIISVRANVEQSYDQIISDLKKAADLLPVTPVHVTRPSRPAAFALLARTYLFMRQYDSAGKYADLSLVLKSDLMDYNSDPEILPVSNNRFNRYNKEVLVDGSTTGVSSSLISPFRAKVDSGLYASYHDDDLRKLLFYRNNGDNTFTFVGNYTNSNLSFNGITTAEMLLTRAECHAKAGHVPESMNDLNSLLRKRWRNTVNFPEFTAVNAEDAVQKIRTERRKELTMRGLRWMDIKRMNKEQPNITLRRLIDANTYTLPPNDLRFALPIPEDVIISSGMLQNPH